MSQNNKPSKVLVVDDDPVIRDMMADILDFEGLPTRSARNGREALELLHGDESYLVFLDLMMPVLDGEQVCSMLAAEPQVRHRHVIVLMSAMDKLSGIPRANFDAAMPKPFTVEDVIEVIEPYLL